MSYIDEDFAALCRELGLTHVRDARAFVSKVMAFDKTADVAHMGPARPARQRASD